MNYLAHAYLSFEHPGLLVGNMIGDYVKGSLVLETFPEEVRNGILLHRRIDAYTDRHPALLRAKNYFRLDYRLYAGAFVDTLNDHFIANDPRCFGSESALLQFTEKVYATVDAYEEVLPERFRLLFSYMKRENWLYHYRTLKGARQSFTGLERRAKYIESSEKAYEIFIGNYYVLNQCYFELIDDLVKFTQKTIAQL